MNQNERLLNYLKINKKINPLQAWESLGIYRLSARVCDLRKLGWNIKSKSKEVLNKFNETCYVAEYELGE